MIYESTRKMTPNEQMAYDLGYNKAKAESAAQLAAVQAERDAASEQLEKVYQIALKAHEETANYDLLELSWSIMCMTRGTSVATAPSGAEWQETK